MKLCDCKASLPPCKGVFDQNEHRLHVCEAVCRSVCVFRLSELMFLEAIAISLFSSELVESQL